jgi:hypothetical protein
VLLPNECLFFVVVYFVIDSVRKLLDKPSYVILPLHQDLLWGQPSLLSTGYRSMKLTTYIHLLRKLWMSGAVPPLSYKMVAKHNDNSAFCKRVTSVLVCVLCANCLKWTHNGEVDVSVHQCDGRCFISKTSERITIKSGIASVHQKLSRTLNIVTCLFNRTSAFHEA